MGKLRSLLRGFGYLTLDPSPRLRRLREQQERVVHAHRLGPLPALPDSAYGEDATPLDQSGVPADDDPLAPLGYAVRCLPWIEPPDRTGHLVCTACPTRLARDPLCSDLAVLTLHWMSEHPGKWAELHPESAEYLP